MSDSNDRDDEQLMDAHERWIFPRAAAVFAIAVATTITAEILEPRLSKSAQPFAAALSRGGVAAAVASSIYALATAASIGSRRLRARGITRAAIRNTVIAVMFVLIAGLFVFLPFCLGSLQEGTYDCIPLGTRFMAWMRN